MAQYYVVHSPTTDLDDLDQTWIKEAANANDAANAVNALDGFLFVWEYTGDEIYVVTTTAQPYTP